MDQIILDSTKKFNNNDIYFLEVILDKIMVNDNYDGVLILDSDLNVLKRIKLLDDLVIDKSFLKNREIVLHCYENQCLIHINIDSFNYKIIRLNSGLEDKIFSPFYEWVDDDLILMADNGAVFVHINLSDNVIQVAQKDMIEKLHFSIYDNWSKLNGFVIHKVYPQRCEVIVESNNIIKLINYKNDKESILKIEPFETAPNYFYDIEMMKNCIAQISEKEISILYEGNNIIFYSDYQHYSFLRGKFITIENKEYLLLLSSSNSNPENVMIAKFSLL